jgi:hypothetical protein
VAQDGGKHFRRYVSSWRKHCRDGHQTNAVIGNQMPPLRIRSSIASSRDMPNRDRRNEVLVARRQARRSAVHRGGVLVDALLRLLSSAVTVRASWLRACSSGSREKNNCAKVGPASSRSRICVRQARAIACAPRRLMLETFAMEDRPPCQGKIGDPNRAETPLCQSASAGSHRRALHAAASA